MLGNFNTGYASLGQVRPRLTKIVEDRRGEDMLGHVRPC